MKLSNPILQSLAIAVASVGVSGCGYLRPSSEQPTTTHQPAPNFDPPTCLPEGADDDVDPIPHKDPCPFCGRG